MGVLQPVDIARVCHEANRAYCRALGDVSQAPFDEAAAWQVDSAIAGVEFHKANPDAPASSGHDSWLAQKRDTGWKYGLVKDEAKKEHPCFVPFENLPHDQQVKDVLFSAIVKALT